MKKLVSLLSAAHVLCRPDGTIITEPYYSDIPVGVMERSTYDFYVSYIESQMAQAAQ